MRTSSVVGLILAVAMVGLVCSAIKGGQDACNLNGGKARGVECVKGER